MISIVVCSIDDKLYEAFAASVTATIGVEHEIIRIDNRVENRNLGLVYNRGAASAQYDQLLFVHEDVLFHTTGWGQILLRYFNELPDAGIIGIMGSDYISYVANGWYVRDQSRIFAHLIQHYKFQDKEPVNVDINSRSPQKIFTVDGVFMAMKKTVWQMHRFNEELEGFHGYDLFLSLSVSNTHQNYFVPGITITHLSEGRFEAQWFRNNLTARKQLFPSLNYLKERNPLQPRIERLLFFESLQNINKLGISREERKLLREAYVNWAKQWLGAISTWVTVLKSKL